MFDPTPAEQYLLGLTVVSTGHIPIIAICLLWWSVFNFFNSEELRVKILEENISF